jgi:hypothetical protein
VAGRFYEHRVVSATCVAFSVLLSMSFPMSHVDHGHPSGNTGWDGIST